MAKKVPFGFINNLLDKFSGYKNFRSSKKFYIILVIVGLLLLAMFKKNWFVAATVNGSPVSNLGLQMRLNRDFRSQTLTQMINEKITLPDSIYPGAEEKLTNKLVKKLASSLGADLAGITSVNRLSEAGKQINEALKRIISSN